MESTLIDLSSLLLLGVLLGCHYLGFRRPARSSWGRTLQRAGKLRMLGVAVVAPVVAVADRVAAVAVVRVVAAEGQAP